MSNTKILWILYHRVSLKAKCLGLVIIGVLLYMLFPIQKQTSNLHEKILQFGIREIWFIHPLSRLDLIRSNTEKQLALDAPLYNAPAWDSNLVFHTNSINVSALSRKYSSEHMWLLENNVDNLSNNSTVVDIYGGWNSHLYCWNRMAAYSEMTQLDIPVLFLEDDIIPKKGFLLLLNNTIRELPEDWTILNLYDKGVCTRDKRFSEVSDSSVAPAYLIRNATEAHKLFLNNNLGSPPLRLNSDNHVVGWQIQLPVGCKTYTICGNMLLKKVRRKTRFPHSPAFTPFL